jgi:hypothetical protein
MSATVGSRSGDSRQGALPKKKPTRTAPSTSSGKTYAYKGKKVSVLSARCADGKLHAFASSIFADGTKASTGIIRTCTAKG